MDRVKAALLLLPFLAATLEASAEPYQKPPAAVLDVLHAPLPPNAFVDPTHQRMILATPVRYPPISDLAQPMLRLAGVRVTTKNNGVHDAPYWADYTLVKLSDGKEQKVSLPPGSKPGAPQWTSDGKRFAFTTIGPDAIELWVGEAASAKVKKISGAKLNPLLRNELRWMPDQTTLLVKLVPAKRGAPPASDQVPEGPKTLEASGASGAISTYEARDVLKTAADADVFEYYGRSQLALVDAGSGKITLLGSPALYAGVVPAPDGTHLRVEYVHRPFSFLTGWERFPTEVEVWDKKGKLVRKIASQPLADNVPIWGVPTGPREFAWRANEPATLTFAEALDGGNWDNKVPFRDRVKMLRAPFTAEPTVLFETELRYTGMTWAPEGNRALREEYDAIRHWTRATYLDVDQPTVGAHVVWDRSTDELYKHPGNAVLRVLPSGFWVLDLAGDDVYMSGLGASPDGDRPFLDRLNLATGKSVRIFRSEKTAFETFVCFLPGEELAFVTRRESPTDPPNYFRRTVPLQLLLTGKVGAPEPPPTGEAAFDSTITPITHQTDPAPAVRGIQKRLVKYKRADGVDLSFTLYLPPGYKEGTRLPTVVWAYPLDYADAKMAGQVVGSTQRFTILGWPLQLFFLLDGYAVIDNPSLPVVGDTTKIYDTYMEQLIAGAEAAVKKAVELGVTDPERIGVTGHSHGGLMTANLLAHTDLFRAGIARSGAYNRSLTAFGFQNERRTVWQAPEVYNKVSAFFSADQIKEPILLIHGDADVNPGTTPMQSERMYEAIRGNGGTVRLVMLPLESHGYRAMETTEHVLAEMLRWFDRYVKQATPRPAKK